jgi:hypothetical protein
MGHSRRTPACACKVFSGVTLCPYQVLLQLEFYADFCRPLGMRHQFCGIVAKDGSDVSFITSTRSAGQSSFGKEHHELLRILWPHLQSALSSSTLRFAKTVGQVEARALDRLPLGVILLSGRGQVI